MHILTQMADFCTRIGCHLHYARYSLLQIRYGGQSGFIACLVFFGSVYAQSRVVSLQLLWNHQFQFAGFYAAEAQGFYEEEGHHD